MINSFRQEIDRLNVIMAKESKIQKCNILMIEMSGTCLCLFITGMEVLPKIDKYSSLTQRSHSSILDIGFYRFVDIDLNDGKDMTDPHLLIIMSYKQEIELNLSRDGIVGDFECSDISVVNCSNILSIYFNLNLRRIRSVVIHQWQRIMKCKRELHIREAKKGV
ncbi:MAG: hypothetical protein EZS28_022940 [Streblomastix strix]|uniref:Uncharacterized protein n=1 Tax=Streblomastix strix TaxID=222440 RepID=A0A5J4VG09_9EUKA|nr:MAG: hypothetical protein EZS28_022940 [Streblomastix strix]